METELLVHVAAGARAADDIRYLAIAQAIQDFRPAIITKVYGFDTLHASTLSLDKHSMISRLVLIVMRTVSPPSPRIYLALSLKSAIVNLEESSHLEEAD